MVNHVARQQGPAFIFQDQRRAFIHFGDLLAQGSLLNQLFQNTVKQNLVGQLLVLFGQTLLQHNHVTQRDIGAIHRRNYRIGILGQGR